MPTQYWEQRERAEAGGVGSKTQAFVTNQAALDRREAGEYFLYAVGATRFGGANGRAACVDTYCQYLWRWL